MGALSFTNGENSGTTFRVWSPFATQVWVSGTFNNWSVNEHLLYSEGNGYWSADIEDAKLNDRYRYVIQKSSLPTDIHWRTDPYCRHVEDNATGDGVIVDTHFDWGNDTFRMPAWNELVVYELHVASFNRDSKVPGNFNSVIEKLNYLKDLGINAIQIMPIIGVPGDFSLGYNPALPFDIESHYGGPIDFKNFIKAAHQRGIAVILDIVLNHFGPDELDTSLWQFDGWNENGRGGIYFYNDWRYRTAFGDRPDYGRGEVRQYLRDNALMWLEEYHLDGLRFDSTVNIRNANGKNNDPGGDIADGWSLMQWINNEVDGRMPWKITIAEDLQDNAWLVEKTSQGGAGFDSQWDSFFYGRLYQAVVAQRDEDRNMESVREAIAHSFQNEATKRLIYCNNHDECAEINQKFRLSDRIWMGNAAGWHARKRTSLAAAVVFTSPGIPMLFQGDEFLEWGSWRDNQGIDWDKRDRFAKYWDLHQSLIRLRRNWFNNTRGLRGQHVHVFHTNNEDKVIAFHRWENGGAGDDVVVVVNFSIRAFAHYTIGFPMDGTWYLRFNSDWNGFSDDFSNHPSGDVQATGFVRMDGLPFSGSVSVGPYSALIFSQ
jgi:1,4-alpha-glucan branching enzyme